ncbi:MAG: histidine phosphatase family protein [Dehalococcoidia bacterium]
MRLLLVRHGETEYNRDWRFQGHSDLGLDWVGRRQATRLRRRLSREPLDLVYSSNLKRAAETAEIIARGRGLRVVPRETLAELAFGEFEGMTYDEIIERYPQWRPDHFDFTAYGGESLEQLAQRIRAFEKELSSHNPADADILIVAHAGPLCVLLCRLLGVDVENWRRFYLMPASLTVVEDVEREPVLSLSNDVSHLKTK